MRETSSPLLGLMLTLDVRSILQMASEIDPPRSRRDDAHRSISFEALDATLLDALVRLVNLLDEPTLVPRLPPLIHQEITIRLLTGPHGPHLRHLVIAGSPANRLRRWSPGSSSISRSRCRGMIWRIART